MAAKVRRLTFKSTTIPEKRKQQSLLTSAATNFNGSCRFQSDLHAEHEPNPNPSREASQHSEVPGRFPSREGSGEGWSRFFLSDPLAGDGAPAGTRRSAYVVPASGRRGCVLCRPSAGRAFLRSFSRQAAGSTLGFAETRIEFLYSIWHMNRFPVGRGCPQPGIPEPGERGWVRSTSRSALIP